MNLIKGFLKELGIIKNASSNQFIGTNTAAIEKINTHLGFIIVGALTIQILKTLLFNAPFIRPGWLYTLIAIIVFTGLKGGLKLGLVDNRAKVYLLSAMNMVMAIVIIIQPTEILLPLDYFVLISVILYTIYWQDTPFLVAIINTIGYLIVWVENMSLASSELLLISCILTLMMGGAVQIIRLVIENKNLNAENKYRHQLWEHDMAIIGSDKGRCFFGEVVKVNNDKTDEQGQPYNYFALVTQSARFQCRNYQNTPLPPKGEVVLVVGDLRSVKAGTQFYLYINVENIYYAPIVTL